MIKSTLKLVFLTLLFGFNTWYSLAQVTTILQNTSFDICSTNLPQTELNLGNLVLSESLATDFEAGIYTFFIQAPSNFEINATTFAETGTDITNVMVSQDSNNASRLEITITSNGQGSLDVVTIENVGIQLIPNASTTDGNLNYILDGNSNNVNGLTDNETLATISFSSLTGGTGVNQEVCAIADVQNISVTGSNVAQNRTFEWEIDENGIWTPIANSNSEILVVDNNTFSNGISKYRRLTTFTLNGETCTLTSTPATITVNEIYPGSITEGNNENICTTDTPQQLSTSSDVAVTPAGAAVYNWFKNDSGTWNPINGATDNFYQPTILAVSTSFKRRITNVINGFSCFDETTPVIIVVNSAVLGGTASNQNLCDASELQAITVTDDTTSGTLTYQWQASTDNTNFTDINNATAANYVPINLNTPISYYRRITTQQGASCQGMSTTGTITLDNFTEGSIQGDTTICNGTSPGTLTSNLNATGQGAISYQWQSSTNNIDFINIPGAINANYSPNVLTQTTYFKRIDTSTFNGSICAAETNTVIVTVISDIAGGTTSNQNSCSLNDLQLLTVNNGENNGTYQWQKSNQGNWENINGATQNIYDASNNITTGVQEFRRVTTVSGASCQGISTVATITFTNFMVGSISGAETVCYNAVPDLLISSVNATGTGSVSYQWEQFDGNSWIVISGANNAEYQPSALQQTTSFRRQDSILLNAFTCSDYTNEIIVTVLDEINGGNASADQTICEGEIPNSIVITNGTTSNVNITYQWQSATTGNFTNINGETNTIFNFANAPLVTTRYRRQTLVANNEKVCYEHSTESTVFVNNLSLGIIGNNQSICAGELPSTLINLSNTTAAGNLSYAWEESTDNGVTWSVIPAAIGSTFTPGILGTSTQYRRMDTSILNAKVCSEYTNEITITVAGIISGGEGSANQVVCENEAPSTISITNGTTSGIGINFQWFSSTDNVNYNTIAGETGESLSFSSGLTASAYFKRNVTLTGNGNTCEATSLPTLVTLLTLSEGAISQTQTVCGSANIAPLTSLADAASNGTITYTWQSSADGSTWSDIANTNQATYTPNNSNALEANYRRKATATLATTSCEAITQSIIIYVNRFNNASNHNITFTSGATGSTVVCNQGDPLAFDTNFTLLASGTLSYQWQISNDNITFTDIPGATFITYDPPAVNADSYYQRMTTSTLNGVSCSVGSNILEIINGGNATAGTVGTTNANGTNGTNEEVICEGGNPSVIEELTPASGQTLAFQWFANNALVPGATSLSYDPPTGLTQTTTYYRTTYSTDISGVTCVVNSNSVVVLVPNANDIGSDSTICNNTVPPTIGNVSTIEGLPYLGFQWYDSDDAITFSAIVGATGATYSPNIAFTSNKFYRRGYVTTVDGNVCGPEELSNTIEVIINVVSGGSVLGDQQICFGEDPGLLDNTTNGTASGALAYQWYSSEDNTNWSLIDGAVNNAYDPMAGSFPTTYFKRTAFSTLNGVVCSEDSNIIVVAVTDEIVPGTLTNNQTICEGDVPAALAVSGGSTFNDQSYNWYTSTDGVIWLDTGVSTASYAPPIPTGTILFKRTTTRTSLNNLTCVVETNTITITGNAVYAGKIRDNQSVCEGDQPDAIVEEESATGIGAITYQWWSSPDNQSYTMVTNATQANYTPPSTLNTSTYFKRVVTSSINGVSCTDETSPKLVTVIPYPIIDNDAVNANDIGNVSCFGGNDGSIVIPNGRITGGNTAQKQINTISLWGTTELNNTYSLIINGIVYEHQVTLNGLNQIQNSDEVAAALAQNINAATGANLSEVIASTNANEIILTAKIAGIAFTAFASTGSSTNASASNVITQANALANTYEWTKIGDTNFTASTLSITDLTAGVYQLTVYNEFCGTTSSPFLVAEPELLTLNIGDTCNTAITAYSTGGMAPFTFTLTRPNGTTLVQTSNNPNITYTNLTGGATYTIKVKDASCGQEELQTITLPLGLQFDEASVVVENATCFGQNDGTISLNIGATTVTGGFPPYDFSWTGPNNVGYSSENITNLVPGVYVLSVTDQIGCTAAFTTNVASKLELAINNVQLTNEQLQCAGDTNAEISIQVNADPSSQLQINWYKNGTSYTTNSTNLTNLGEGTYEVIVTDTNSDPNAPCTSTKSFEIVAPQLFSATKVTTTNPNCFDTNANRTFTVAVQGGTAPYQYVVDNGTPVFFNTLETTITSLTNDNHSIYVTDTNQCVVQSFTMDRYDAISYAGTQLYTLEICEATFPFTLDNNLVAGGSPFIDANNISNYLYDWTGPNNFMAQDITSFNALPGTYGLTITDSRNCSSEVIEFTFNAAYDPITVDKAITLVSCGSTSDGAISIALNGGNRPYDILWEKEEAGTTNNPAPVFTPLGQNITLLNGLEVGRYRLTVTSTINGCTQIDPSYFYKEIITLNKTESLQLLDGPYFDQSLCLGNPGSISVSIFNNQGGDLSFYYENVLMPSVKTGIDTYAVQIANPLENATLNVVNNQGCGFTMPLSAGVMQPTFTYSSEEFEITGLLLAKEDIRFNNTSEIGYDYASWGFGDGSPIISVDPNAEGSVSTHSYNFPGIFTTTLTLYNQQGCSKEVQQSVQIGKGYDVMFPNVFSANADGINDYFQGEFTGIASFTFQIYDMWGALIYSVAHDFGDMPINWGWDGNLSTGKPYSNTSFRYLFVGTTTGNNQITKTGEASILR